MSDQESHEGGCLCGRVRYRIEGPIESIGHCHCAMCRRANGAVMVTWLDVSESRFTLTRGGLARYASSGHGKRGFCANCGTQITFSSAQFPGSIDVTVGSLDHPEDHPADRHMWVGNKLPWLEIDEALPRHAEFTYTTQK